MLCEPWFFWFWDARIALFGYFGDGYAWLGAGVWAAWKKCCAPPPGHAVYCVLLARARAQAAHDVCSRSSPESFARHLSVWVKQLLVSRRSDNLDSRFRGLGVEPLSSSPASCPLHLHLTQPFSYTHQSTLAARPPAPCPLPRAAPTLITHSPLSGVQKGPMKPLLGSARLLAEGDSRLSGCRPASSLHARHGSPVAHARSARSEEGEGAAAAPRARGYGASGCWCQGAAP